MRLTYRYRVKDKHSARLNRMARAANFVWNFCNNTQRVAVSRGRRWPTAFDLINLTRGTSKDLGLHSDTVSSVCQQYAASRQQCRRTRLRYRGRRSLGWVPFRGRFARPTIDGIRFAGVDFHAWLSRPLPDGITILDGSNFSSDARGRWYLNLVVDVADVSARDTHRYVGIDLGLKALATTSDGLVVAAPQIYRSTQERLSRAKRANRKGQARTIYAKIANQRRDFLHKLSTDLVRRYDLIAVGNVSSKRLARTRMAKSVLDAGWSTLRNQLRYKAITHGARYVEVDERFTTQTCSECGLLGGPQGRKGLRVREWTCVHCGVVHDRDVNSARVILGLGHQTP